MGKKVKEEKEEAFPMERKVLKDLEKKLSMYEKRASYYNTLVEYYKQRIQEEKDFLKIRKENTWRN